MSVIKQMVRDENQVEFAYYRDRQLWYEVMYMDDSMLPQKFLFPVPIEDIGNATFTRVEKALLLMRYIRKHLKTLEEKDNEDQTESS